ncbi:MAG: hypothetical protein EXR36_04400 [Betaproteobacteria bacterium]|nr:hypothetical protein [Betaproteobacteria bacterium]
MHIVLNSKFFRTLNVGGLALKALRYDGPLSVHTEYEFDESIIRQVGYADTVPENLEEWASADAAYLKKVWGEIY